MGEDGMGIDMRRRITIKRKKQNRLGMFLVTTVVLMLLVVVAVKSVDLREKQESYANREQELLNQIADEENRTEEIEEFKKYTKTKKYAEEIAKDKLGLVYEDEIIFKIED